MIIISLTGQFLDIKSPERLSEHDIVSGTLKAFIPPIKKPRRKVYRYQKGDNESMMSDALKFAKERYFNGYSDSPSVQENFNLITTFIQDFAYKHIPSKTRIGVYETLCPQQMLVHKGGNIKNWGGECRDATPTKSLSQNIRVDVNREVKFF